MASFLWTYGGKLIQRLRINAVPAVLIIVFSFCGQFGTLPLTMYLGLPIRTVVDTSSFDKTVDAMVANYRTVRDEFGTGQLAAIDDELWKMMRESGQSPPPPERSIVDFSNLGVIENFMKSSYGDLQIKSVRQQCRESMRMIFMFMSTFRSKLRASISYNDRFHMTEEIQRFAELFKSELLGGLGVARDCESLEAPL